MPTTVGLATVLDLELAGVGAVGVEASAEVGAAARAAPFNVVRPVDVVETTAFVGPVVAETSGRTVTAAAAVREGPAALVCGVAGRAAGAPGRTAPVVEPVVVDLATVVATDFATAVGGTAVAARGAGDGVLEAVARCAVADTAVAARGVAATRCAVAVAVVRETAFAGLAVELTARGAATPAPTGVPSDPGRAALVAGRIAEPFGEPGWRVAAVGDAVPEAIGRAALLAAGVRAPAPASTLVPTRVADVAEATVATAAVATCRAALGVTVRDSSRGVSVGSVPAAKGRREGTRLAVGTPAVPSPSRVATGPTLARLGR